MAFFLGLGLAMALRMLSNGCVFSFYSSKIKPDMWFSKCYNFSNSNDTIFLDFFTLNVHGSFWGRFTATFKRIFT